MDSKTMRWFVALIFLLAVIGFVAATGYLKSQTGSVVLIPSDNQVLPNVTDTVNLGSSSFRWAQVHSKEAFIGNVTVTGSLNVTSTNVVYIGGACLRWNTTHMIQESPCSV